MRTIPTRRNTVYRFIGLVLVGIAAALSLGIGSAGAQDDASTTGKVLGVLQYRDADNQKVPVAGVTISLADEGGAELASVVTDADGNFVFPDLEPGIYTVTIDPSGLPDQVTLRDPERTSVTVTVDAGRETRALFAVEHAEGTSASSGGSSVNTRRVLQLTVEGLKQGLYLAMAAIGLSLIFGTTGLTNFAHAEMITWGMLTTYFFNFYGLAGLIGFMAGWPAPFGGGVNLVWAALLGMVCGGLLGYGLDRFLFRRFRAAGISLIAQMVITIGLSIFLRYLFLYNFGGTPRTFRDFSAQRALEIGPIDLTPKDIIAMILSVVVLLGVGSLLQFTRVGKAMRAVADNRDLAESSGIDVQMVISWVWIAGGALAALGGVFFGLDQLKWDFGWRILLLVFAAVVLGGLGTAYGALVGALVVGIAINVSTLWIDAELKNMIALIFMVVVLLFRPQGILGRPERIG
ncbi:MAG: branched-chain amino acid ABC transporter permease [Actinomyces sp.]|nr:MAG: branched-chain amino acid ABC transporter permease [Actinomyces sp.]